MASELTKIIANFQTTLAAKVTAGDVAGTLAGNTDKEGNTLPTGVYGFTINEGKSNEQHMKCLLTGTAMTVVKGITHAGVESTGFLKDAGINSPIKITDFVNILRIVEILNGTKSLDSSSPMKYDAEFSVTDRKQVITAGYAQDLLSGAVGTATETSAGTNKMTKTQGSKPRARSTLVREQDTPDKTLKVETFRMNFADTIYNYAGGNTPNFIDPAFGGDLSIALQPANGETVIITVDGVATTLTFVTTIGATPGNILIGASAATARANLVAFLNNPSVTSATQVAVTGTNLTAIQKLSATDDASLNAFIRVINTSTTSFSVSETMAGAGNIWTVNSTKNRIDLVVVDSSSTLQIRKGSEAVSPTYPTPTSGDLVLCSVYNKPGQTTVLDRTSGGSGYILEWFDLSAYRTDLATTATVNAVRKFGGSGADGALIVSSGATNIDLGGQQIVVKNYTTIQVTGTGQVTFSNPHANGTIIILKSQGDVVLTSSTIPNIDASGMGAAGGAGGSGGTTNNGGSAGNTGTNIFDDSSHGGNGAVNNSSGGAGGTGGAILVSGTIQFYTRNAYQLARGLKGFACGSGGGGGAGNWANNARTGGAGGNGGGGLLIECGGSLNFTSTLGISVAGKNGSNGVTDSGGSNNGRGGSGGGGGGAGGFCIVLYNSLTSASGTINTTGGTGGTGGDATSDGTGGGGGQQIGGGGGGGAGSDGGAGGAGANQVSSQANGNAGSAAAGRRGGGGGGSGASRTYNSAGTQTGGAGGAGGASENVLVAQNNYFA